LKPAPTINDTTPVVGQTLTASVSDWTPTQDSFAYSWSRTVGGVTSVIVDASSATYTVVAADLGATLTVTATATLDGYATTAVASTATSAVANGTFDVSPAPTISGTATIGQTLTATAGDWSPSATLAYQWKRNGNVIAGATSSTYTVQLADATATITVSVTGSRTAYTSITRTSVATSTIEPLTFTDVVPPTIDGADVVGKPLRASTGTWSPTQDRFTYQWLCDGDPIVAATASTFTPTGTELGCEISVEMTGIKLGYRSITLTSDVTGAIDYGTFDATPNPTISGTLAVGNTLTANPGTWVPSAELSYQWTRDGEDIDGATDSTYTLTADDFDCVIGVYVVGTKLGYLDSNFLPSADTAAIALGTIRPAPTPTVSGTVKVGSTLTATVGTWGGLGDDVAVSYQWTRTKAGVTTEIDGATDDSYVLTADDLGATMRFVVTGTMAGYADANKSSSATATVAKGAFASPHVPTLTGTVAVGKTVTVDMGDWSPNEPTFSYQWFRGKKAIAGATSSTFVPRTIDIGTKIWVTVGATELGFIPITLDSSKSLVAMGAFDTSPVPTISSSGTFTVGETLTATAGSWTPGPSGTTLTYQWFRGGVAIAGQTAATYVLQGGDAGTSITVTVTATRDGFVTTTRTSLSTSLIAKADFTASPTPLIVLPNGSPAKVGEIVSVNIGDWAPLQFPLWTPVAGRIAYSYQWYLDGVAVDGATHTTYQLLAADLGKSVSVTVTATMLGYNTVTKTSASTDAVDIGAFSPAPSPTISGVRAVGSTLTANLGTWGPVAPSFTYRWKRDGTPIGSADGVSYVLTPDDLGHTITVTVRATAPAFAVANQTSDPTAEIALGDFVAGTPSISGTMGAGSTLTALTGTWSPNDIGTTFSYQWLKNGQPILHATDSTYVPPVADVTTYYSVRVTASRDGFTTLAVVSASRLVVKGTMTATVRPTITGTFAYDQVLTGSDGTWSPVLDGATFTYQWFRGKKAIRGATSSTYRITGSDLGAKLSFQVTVTAIGYNNGVAKSVAAVIP
jgi:hypothetical protein